MSHHISSCSGVRRQLRSPHISPYLPHVSPYLELQRCAATAQISPYLPISPPYLTISRTAAVCGDSSDLPISPHISPISHHISSCSGVRRQLRSPHISPYLPHAYLELQASAYGKALGANADLKLLNEILLRCQPPIPAGKQQELSHLIARPSPISWAVHRASAMPP